MSLRAASRHCASKRSPRFSARTGGCGRGESGVGSEHRRHPIAQFAYTALAFGGAVDNQSGLWRPSGNGLFVNGERLAAELVNFIGQRLGMGDRAIGDNQFSLADMIAQVKRHGARRAAGAQEQHIDAIQRPHETCRRLGRRQKQTIDKSCAVGVVADQPAIGGAYHRIDGVNPRRAGIEVVEEIDHAHFVRHSDVDTDELFGIAQNPQQVADPAIGDVERQIDGVHP